jgi:hypothetical protein
LVTVGSVAEIQDPIDLDPDLPFHLRGRILFDSGREAVHHGCIFQGYRFPDYLVTLVARRVPNDDGDLRILLEVGQGPGAKPFRDGKAIARFSLHPPGCRHVG